MGVGDTVSRVMLQFRADTSKARSEIGKLTGAQKKAAREAIDAQERQNKSLDDQIVAFGKVAAGVASAVVAYKGLTAAANSYAKHQQLIAAAAGADIKAIQNAARGLLTETEALTFAAAAQNTAFQLSQEQMEIAAKAMISLRNQGNDFAEVQKRVTQAVVEGNSEALKPFGIIVKGASGEAETFTKVMAALAEEASKTTANMELAGDAALEAAVRMDDATLRMSNALGSLGQSKGMQILQNVLSDAVDGFAFVLNGFEKLEAHSATGMPLGLDVEGQKAWLTERKRALELTAEIMKARISGSRGGEDLIKEYRIQLGETYRELELVKSQMLAIREGEISKLPTFGPDLPPGFEGNKGRGARAPGPGFQFGGSVLPGVDASIGVPVGTMAKGAIPRLGAPPPPPISPQNEALVKQSELLSDLSKRWEEMADGMNIASEAAGIFTGAGNRAFSEWLSGTSSLNEAMANFGQNVLKSTAQSMWGKGLEAAGMALFALGEGIFGADPKGFAAAGKYAAASAAFLTGATLIGSRVRGGAGAGGMGASGGGGGGALPAAAQSPASGGGTSSQTFIVVQSPFEDNPREAQRRARRFIDRAQEGGSRTGAVIRA